MTRSRMALSFGERLDLDLLVGEDPPPLTGAMVVPQDIHLILGETGPIEDTRETPEQVLAAPGALRPRRPGSVVVGAPREGSPLLLQAIVYDFDRSPPAREIHVFEALIAAFEEARTRGIRSRRRPAPRHRACRARPRALPEAARPGLLLLGGAFDHRPPRASAPPLAAGAGPLRGVAPDPRRKTRPGGSEGLVRADPTLVLAAVLAGATVSALAGEREDALLMAVRKGDVAAVKALLDQGVPVDTSFRYDRTALSFAADRGNVEHGEAAARPRSRRQPKDTLLQGEPGDLGRRQGARRSRAAAARAGRHRRRRRSRPAVARRAWRCWSWPSRRASSRPRALLRRWSRRRRPARPTVAARLREAGAVPPPKADFTVDAAALARYAGRYQEEGREQVLTSSVAEGALQSSLGGPPRKLAAIDAATFRDLNASGLVTLEVKLEGDRVQGLTLNETGVKRSFTRVEERHEGPAVGSPRARCRRFSARRTGRRSAGPRRPASRRDTRRRRPGTPPRASGSRGRRPSRGSPSRAPSSGATPSSSPPPSAAIRTPPSGTASTATSSPRTTCRGTPGALLRHRQEDRPRPLGARRARGRAEDEAPSQVQPGLVHAGHRRQGRGRVLRLRGALRLRHEGQAARGSRTSGASTPAGSTTPTTSGAPPARPSSTRTS